MNILTLTPGQVTLDQLAQIYREECAVRLDRAAKPAIEAAAAAIDAAAAGDVPVYGVNTGFGKLASMRIAPKDTATLQRNLIFDPKDLGMTGPQTHMVLSVSGLTKDYPGVRAVDDVSFAIERGTVHCLVGENGAGKSTLVKTIYGLVKPDAGTMSLEGRPFQPPEPRAARAAGAVGPVIGD
mgnify:CR=1 FL=1